MNNFIKRMAYFCLFFVSISLNTYAKPAETKRFPQFDNDKVKVWKTIIYPGEGQALKFHRHERDRVLVALDSGVLKVVNDKGKTHYINLQKDQAYYLRKDKPDEKHIDVNMTNHPISVFILELKF